MTDAAPHNHLAAGPDCGVRVSRIGHVVSVSRSPTVGEGVIPAAAVQIDVGRKTANATPHNHFAASPHRCMQVPRIGGVGGVGSCPTICARVISAARVKILREESRATPNDHFTSGPHCRVTLSGIWRDG